MGTLAVAVASRRSGAPTDRATSQAIGPPTSKVTRTTAGIAAKRSAIASRAERSIVAMTNERTPAAAFARRTMAP